jgi:hypothetical protein
VIKQVDGTNQSPHAVTDQEDRLAGPYPVKVDLDCIRVILKTFHVYPRAIGFAVTGEIESMHGVAKGDEVIDNVDIPPAMLGQPVNNK